MHPQEKWKRAFRSWVSGPLILGGFVFLLVGFHMIWTGSEGYNPWNPASASQHGLQKDFQELVTELMRTRRALDRHYKALPSLAALSANANDDAAPTSNLDTPPLQTPALDPTTSGAEVEGEGASGELTKPETSALSVEQADERKDLFTHIWRTGFWGSESKSGPGSTLEYTANARQLISAAIKKYSLKNMLDAPCGDGHWIGAIDGIGTSVHYTGADIVPDAAVANMRKYLDRPNMRFVNLDLAMDPLPKNTFDFIHCRDALQHLPVQTCLDIIANFEQTGAKYLITNFYYPGNSNAGVSLADERAARAWFFQIDPHQPPFNFSKPMMYIAEASEGKHLAVYKLPVLGTGDGSQFIPSSDSVTRVVHLS